MSQSDTPISTRTPRAFPIFTILLGIVGWFASFQLLTEYMQVLANPSYSPNCNVSLLVTCGPNMESWQGSLLGFSNTIIGVTAFVAPIIVGAAMLAGARFPAWFWTLYNLGLTAGFVFVCWLAYQSIFELATLCPWCMVVWLVMIPLWWSTVLRSFALGLLPGSPGVRRVFTTLYQWTWVIVFGNYLLIALVAQVRLNWLASEFGLYLF